MARKCPLCGSRKWRKDGVTGSVVCEDGHVLQGVRSETHVVGEPTGHAMQRRRPARGPRENKRRMEGRADKSFLHGEEAENLRLQGLQLMLRYQVQALKRLWSLPDVYEAIVRDLWTYQLSITPPLTTKGKPQGSNGNKRGSPAVSPQPSESEGSGSETEKADEDSDKEDEEGKDDWDEKLDSSEVSTDDDEELLRVTKEGSEPIPRPRRGNADRTSEAWKRNRPLHVSDVLSCLILGLWIIRTPFMFKDIETLINTNAIPFIDFGKTTLVPQSMREAMNVGVRVGLRPQRSPSAASLWRHSREFARILHRRFGLFIPEINVIPVVWRVVSLVGGNAITHYQVLAFLRLIDANMGIVDSALATYVRRRRNSDTQETIQYTTRARDLQMPELSIAAAWVIVMKLSYGLDGRPRLPLVSTDPLIGLPKGDAWVSELQKLVLSGELRDDNVRRKLFDTMEGKDIDGFLDQCEDILLKHRDFGMAGNAFPLPSRLQADSPSSPPDPWTSFHDEAKRDPVIQATPIAPDTANAELPLMPGDAVRSFGVNDISYLPRDLQIVIRAAADVVGVLPTQVADIVELFERKMEKERPRRVYGDLRRRFSGSLRETRSFSSLPIAPS